MEKLRKYFKTTTASKHFYILIVFLCLALIAAFCSRLFVHNKYPLILSGLFLFLALALPLEDSFYLMFIFLPCEALFDGFGFTYTINFIIAIVSLKYLFLKKDFLNPLLILPGLILIYDVILILINGYPISSVLSSTSNFFAYSLFLTFACREKPVNGRWLYASLFIGLFLSFCFGFLEILYLSKGNISIHQRYWGMLRDPNYFAYFCLILIFSYNCFFRSGTFKAVFVELVLLTIGTLSYSKMFFFCVLLGFMIYLLLNFRRLLSESKTILVASFLVLISLTVAYFTGLLSNVIEKILLRFQGTDLTTGRLTLDAMFIKGLFDSPLSLLFGRSTNYALFYHFDFGGSTNVACHCVYIELLLSWGLFGAVIVFAIAVAYLNANRKRASLLCFLRSSFFVCLLVTLFCLAALPWLTADIAPLSFLFLGVAYQNEKIPSFAVFVRRIAIS